mmetsp:Transcript_30374/g.64057  ORF Transcript_30374/g.64057 Transcript_30374/m.64057 type:complete len:526 (+) Transcript_30374:216-1793(+)
MPKLSNRAKCACFALASIASSYAFFGGEISSVGGDKLGGLSDDQKTSRFNNNDNDRRTEHLQKLGNDDENEDLGGGKGKDAPVKPTKNKTKIIGLSWRPQSFHASVDESNGSQDGSDKTIRVTTENFELKFHENSTEIECELFIPNQVKAPTFRKGQCMIHVHGFPHSGTGVLRNAVAQTLNDTFPGSVSFQDHTLNGGEAWSPEDEGQHLQSTFPTLQARKHILNTDRKKYLRFYGKMMYIGDMCTMADETQASNSLFHDWSHFWANPNAPVLMQKSPTLDVQLLERLKVLPTFHAIIVRHPMMIAPDWDGMTADPMNWLSSWTHVLDGLAEEQVDWYAVVTYEALVQYRDRVVEELAEVLRSGMTRHGIELGDKMSREINEGVARALRSVDQDKRTANRRLHLHNSDKDYLKPIESIIERWNTCLDSADCGNLLRTLSSEILPSFGYVSEGSETLSETPGKVTTKDAYGHVLFSSEGGALKALREKRQLKTEAGSNVGYRPSRKLLDKMNELLLDSTDARNDA